MTTPGVAAAEAGLGGESAWLVPPEVAERAVHWWLQQQDGDLRAPQQAQLQAWRAADPLHEQAWQRIVSVNQRLADLVEPQQAAIARAALARRGSPRRRRVVQALAVLAFGSGLAWQLEQRTPWQGWVADVRTARGERRRMVLDDGTQIVLNGASALNIDYGPRQRRLRLLEGEVLVTTAADRHQPARSLWVQTDQGQALALGTRFTVRARAGGTQVAVFEGAVRLMPRQAPHAALVLEPGQQALLQAHQVSAPVVAHEEATAWTEGMLIARGMPLSEVLAALQPYSAATLVCEPQVAGLRISGTYPLAEVPRVLAALGALPRLQVRELTRWWGGQEVIVGSSD